MTTRRTTRRLATAGLSALLLASGLCACSGGQPGSTQEQRATQPAPPPRARLVVGSGARWPAHGQTAVQLDGGPVTTRGASRAAPIASVAKVMTAYLVLTHHPLPAAGVTSGDFALTITPDQVEDTERRRARGESVVRVAAGETLTERQALEALLLPSANNIALALATADAGSADAFVRQMNEQAAALGMHDSHYSDPSGYDDDTTSTAADQVRLFAAAMRLPVLAGIVAEPAATLPVAGRVTSTDTLLGRDGFLGGKTGSTAEAGGCFVFQAVEVVHARRTLVTGAVLGQPGRRLVTAGQDVARRLLDSLRRPGAVTPADASGTGGG